MRLNLAAVLTALVSATLIAAPSPSHAQVKDLMEKSKKAQKKDGKAKSVRSLLKKGGKKAEQKKGETKK
jgi:hypothetical protein